MSPISLEKNEIYENEKFLKALKFLLKNIPLFMPSKNIIILWETLFLFSYYPVLHINFTRQLCNLQPDI